MKQTATHKNPEALYVAASAMLGLFALTALNGARPMPAQIDEFIVLFSAKAIYQGALPYRDYFNFIPPLSHAIYAALFYLTGGPNAGAARLLTDLVIVFSALLSYSLLRHFKLRPWAASLPALILVALFFGLWPIPLHHWWGLFFSLLSLRLLATALARSDDDGSNKSKHKVAHRPATMLLTLASGLFLGMSGLAVQTHGFIDLMALLAMLLVRPQLQQSPTHAPALLRDRELLRHLLWLSLGALLMLAVFIAYLVVTGTLRSFFNESIVFVFFQYSSGHNHNSMPFLSDVPSRLHTLATLHAPLWIRAALLSGTVATLVVVFCSALLSLLMALVALAGKSWRVALALSLPWLAAWLAMLGRPDLFHLAFYGLIPLLSTSLALFFLCRQDSGSAPLKEKKYLLFQSLNIILRHRIRLCFAWKTGLSLALALGLWGHLLLPWLQGARVPAYFAQAEDSDPVFAGLPAVDAALVQNNGLFETLRAYHLKHTDATLFASINGIPAYFLSMPPACRETVVYAPGNSFSGPRQYQRVLDDFHTHPPELLLFTPQNADQRYLHPAANNAPARAWVEYVRQHYHFVLSNGRGKIYLRNDAPADLF